MRFSYLSAAALALASSVGAQEEFFDPITSPTRDQVLTAGQEFDIVWVPGTVEGTISITLLAGTTNITLLPGPIIASGIVNQLGKFTWTPQDGGAETYGLRIDSDTNKTQSEYSQPFHITGTGAQTTTIKLSTGPSYSSTTTSSIPSSTVTVVSTSTSANNTPSTSASSTVIPSSNVTIVTSATAKTSSHAPTTSTTSSTPTATHNAAVAKVASGGLAIVGGLVLVLAL